MSSGIVTASYIAASVLFILALGGLSNQEKAKRAIWFGIAGMFIAIIATIFGPEVEISLVSFLLPALIIGSIIGVFLAQRVQMTEMPELVAILHSLVGMAAVLVGLVNFINPTQEYIGVEKTIHSIEVYVGIFIGMVTFSGSIIGSKTNTNLLTPVPSMGGDLCNNSKPFSLELSKPLSKTGDPVGTLKISTGSFSSLDIPYCVPSPR